MKPDFDQVTPEEAQAEVDKHTKILARLVLEDWSNKRAWMRAVMSEASLISIYVEFLEHDPKV